MLQHWNRRAAGTALLLAMLAAAPALADVKAGVDAWSRGDYAAAVKEWEGPAAAGDPDAMFNLGQAYRLGRGVPTDLKRAESLYARAAAAGHVQAADTYGLMLFQDGRREAALPYVRDAASRGDPRSQYLLGIAHFNGDIVDKDWVRAYALLILANGAGLPQAAPAIAEMDAHIPLAQRQQAAGLAVQLRSEAEAARATELAAADLAARPAPAAPPAAAPSGRVPRPIATVAVSPSIAAARAAVAEARRATGTENPGEAGASFARPGPAVAVAASPPPVPAQRPARTDTPPPVARAETPAPAAASGPWRVQLGAFSVAGNAESLWNRLRGRSELAGKQRLMVPAGRVTKLQAGGFASRSAADAACSSLKQSGQDCLVTQR
ncbi:MAG TPA: SPOR domain-containing protein [Croceibacterium sp.]|nr:SPOR domain-containing protein [Croceibacterium sp.]